MSENKVPIDKVPIDKVELLENEDSIDKVEQEASTSTPELLVQLATRDARRILVGSFNSLKSAAVNEELKSYEDPDKIVSEPINKIEECQRVVCDLIEHLKLHPSIGDELKNHNVVENLKDRLLVKAVEKFNHHLSDKGGKEIPAGTITNAQLDASRRDIVGFGRGLYDSDGFLYSNLEEFCEIAGI